MCCTDSWSWKPVCLKVILHSSKEQWRQTGDRGGRLLAVESCYMGGEAVFAVRLSVETQSTVALSVSTHSADGWEATSTSPESQLPVVGQH